MTLAGPVEERATEGSGPPAPAKKRKKIKSGEGRLALFLIAPTIVLLALVVGYPIVDAVQHSFLTD